MVRKGNRVATRSHNQKNMQWTEKHLERLKEINNLKKVPRYFAIKKLVEEMIEKNQRENSLLSFRNMTRRKFHIIDCDDLHGNCSSCAKDHDPHDCPMKEFENIPCDCV